MISQIVIFSVCSLVCNSLPYQVLDYGSPPAPLYEAKPQPYSFNVDVKDEYGTTLNRQEVGDELGNKRGSYGYTDAYGISRQVDYVADEKGFRAVVKTNEPGTENQNPADVEIISNAVPFAYGSPSVPAYTPSVSSGPILINGAPRKAIADISSLSNKPLRQINSIPSSLDVSPNAYSSVSSQAIAPLRKQSLPQVYPISSAVGLANAYSFESSQPAVSLRTQPLRQAIPVRSNLIISPNGYTSAQSKPKATLNNASTY